MGKGASENTSSNSSAPPPEVMEQYRNLIAQGNQVAANPLQQYNGQMIAGFTPDQMSAFDTINNSQGITAPYMDKAQGMIDASQKNLWDGVQQWSPENLQQYMNPYQNDVINATMANINETNAQQQQGVVGNAISKGAWGGDRAGIAQAELARQQALASNQTLAGLNASNYGQATQQFNTQQQAQLGANAQQAYLASQGASAEAGLGNQALQNSLQGASAQLTSGQMQQQLAQQALNIPYEQFMQQQSYPYQNLSWLSGISTGLGSGMGGTSTSTTPGPSQFSQIAGLAAAGAGAFAASDRRFKKNIEHIGSYKGYPLYNFEYKGSSEPQTGVMAQDVEKINPDAVRKDGEGMRFVNYSKLARGGSAGFSPYRANGGMVPDIDLSYIPTSVQLTRGMGIPSAPAPYKPDESGNNQLGASLGSALSKLSKGKDTAGISGLSAGTGFTPSDIDKIGADFNSYGGGFAPGAFMARGGYADGGMLDEDSVYDPATDSGVVMPEPIIAQPPQDAAMAQHGISPASPQETAFQTPREAISPQAAFGSPPQFSGAGADPINKPDPWLALAIAGATAAAGQSPHALSNIGAGAAAGLKNYQDQKTESAKESYQQGTLKQQGEKLFDDANEWRNKLFEQQTHDSSSESQQQQDLDERMRHNRADESHAAASLAQGKYVMSPYGQVLNTRTGEVTGAALGNAPIPSGPDGKPLSGPMYMDYLTANDPDRAMRAKMLIDGDKKMPSITGRTDPAWKQAILDARTADPTVSEERFSNKQKFQADTKGQMDTFNTIPSHLKVLEEASVALDNGNTQALNSIKNTWRKQMGSELPTNLDTARNMVSAEIVKAITGAGGVSDRKDAQEQFDKAASEGQLMGAVNMTKHLIGERINAAAYRYKQTVGGNYYDYIRPENREYLGVGNEEAPKDTAATGETPKTAPAAAPSLPSNLPAGSKYSPSRKMWKDPNGQLYDADGKPVS